jgi:4-hydroxy-tetrahydrodipicolinate synthase
VTVHALRKGLAGVVAPIVTPYDERGEVSRSGLRAVVDFLSEAGVAAVIPGDLIGEFFSLTVDERRRLAAETVELAQGRLLVIALTADASPGNAVELARAADKAGADVVKLALPYPYTPPPSATLDLFRRIADATDRPFLIESSDACTIPLDVIVALAERPNFLGLEEWGSDVARMDRLYRDLGDRLVILPSGETALLYLTLLGTPGLISAEVNFAPRFMASYLDACRRRDLDRALELFGRRRRYRDLFREDLNRGLPAFATYAKAAMQLIGLPVGPPRLPQEPLSAAQTSRLRDVLRQEFDLTVPGG